MQATATNTSEMIEDFMRQTFPDFDSRLEGHEEVLAEMSCTNPTVGRWFENSVTEYLLAAFAMRDEDFAEEFPGVTGLDRQERQQVLATFESHLASCERCALKRGFEHEFEARLTSACRQNSGVILELLSEEGV